MHLHEEYIKRHNLKVPLIRYDRSSVVLLKSKKKPTHWRILTVSWSSCYWHPGSFAIMYWLPRHDSTSMAQRAISQEIYWDKYESEILSLRRFRDDFYAIPGKEKALEVWSVFLLTYDTYLSNLSDRFRNLVADSIDPNIDMLDRISAFSQAQLLMHNEDSRIKEAWNSHCNIYQKYADWLVNLING